MAAFARLLRQVVEHVFLVDQGGTPLAHLSRSHRDRDTDVGGPTSALVREFMDHSLQHPGRETGRSNKFPDLHVAFGSGQYTRLFVLYRGRESNRIGRRVERAIREIEKRYGRALKDGGGRLDQIADVNRDLERQWGLQEPIVPSGSLAVKVGGTVHSPGLVWAIIVPPIDARLR